MRIIFPHNVLGDSVWCLLMLEDNRAMIIHFIGGVCFDALCHDKSAYGKFFESASEWIKKNFQLPFWKQFQNGLKGTLHIKNPWSIV